MRSRVVGVPQPQRLNAISCALRHAILLPCSQTAWPSVDVLAAAAEWPATNAFDIFEVSFLILYTRKRPPLARGPCLMRPPVLWFSRRIQFLIRCNRRGSTCALSPCCYTPLE